MFFLPEDVGEPFVDDFLSIVLEGSHLPDLPPLLIVSLLGRRFLGRQFEVAEGAEQPDFCPCNFHLSINFYVPCSICAAKLFYIPLDKLKYLMGN